MNPVTIHILNAGGTIGMVGSPLRPAKSAEQLIAAVPVPAGLQLTLEDFPLQQDSTNLNHTDRQIMLAGLNARYTQHDAYVILQGTDSLAETCAFLSMASGQSLRRSVFVIGSQLPMGEPGSDASLQLGTALRIIPEFVNAGWGGVFTVSQGNVLHGSRVIKRSHTEFDVFHTPGLAPAARLGSSIRMGSPVIERARGPLTNSSPLELASNFEKNVTTIIPSADDPSWVLTDLAKQGRMKGVILVCKGAGNIPTRPWEDELHNGSLSWVDAISTATALGLHVAIRTPFDEGTVDLTAYEPGAKAKDAGALSLGSLTPAMADVKFRFALAKYPNDPAAIQRYLSTNFVGELLETPIY